MKKTFSIFPVLIISMVIFSFNTTSNSCQPVNTVIGDISFIKKFNCLPNKKTDECLRLKTHLEYVEMELRKKDISNLPEPIKQKRLHLLDLLHNYWTAGMFPHNYDYVESRMPCFIDKDNNVCAVGYLIEKTAGRKVAEQVNEKYQYEKIENMNDALVDNWIKNSGLTKIECAMIQPSYGPTPVYTYNHISPSYGISSSILGGTNLALNALNAIEMSKGENKKVVPIIGMLTGSAQLILGTVNFSKNTTTLYGNATNESKKTLSMVNIGMGTSAILLSAWNLLSKKKAKNKLTSISPYSFSNENTQLSLGFCLRRKL